MCSCSRTISSFEYGCISISVSTISSSIYSLFGIVIPNALYLRSLRPVASPINPIRCVPHSSATVLPSLGSPVMSSVSSSASLNALSYWVPRTSVLSRKFGPRIYMYRNSPE